MIINIQTDSKIPIYLQIYEGIVSAMADNELKSGDILPSSRRLAKDLGLNYHTVNKAYNLLEMEGLVVIDNRKRVIVSSADTEQKEEFTAKWRSIEMGLIKEAKAKGVSQEEIIEFFTEMINLLKER